jgi:hypothetical protein
MIDFCDHKNIKGGMCMKCFTVVGDLIIQEIKGTEWPEPDDHFQMLFDGEDV